MYNIFDIAEKEAKDAAADYATSTITGDPHKIE